MAAWGFQESLSSLLPPYTIGRIIYSVNNRTTPSPTPSTPQGATRQRRIMIAAAILISLFVFGELWRRISQAAEMRSLENQIGAQVTQLSEESNRMNTLIAGAQSDDAVAAWARGEGKMALPGEVLVQPVAPGSQTPQPTSSGQPASSPPNWMVWLEWLWGSE
jgi:cell division protein FtsB